jgi:hypothetical protein
MIDELFNIKLCLLSLGITIGFIYITSDNNIILKKKIE